MAADEGRVLQLAGFALGHAVWSVEDGETLVTMAFTEINGERELVRFVADDIPTAVENARLELRRLLGEDDFAALVFDAFATPDGSTRTDALVVEVLGSAAVRIGYIAQPYRPAKRRIPLVGRPTGFALLELPSVMDGFSVADPERHLMIGVREHGKADRHFDDLRKSAG